MRGRRGELPAQKQEEDKEEVEAVEVWIDEVIRPVEKVIESAPVYYNVTRFGGHESMGSLYSYKSQTPEKRKRI